MKTFKDRVVAITGAGDGIGRALAIDCGGRGAKLAISDVDTEGLAETASMCESLGYEVFAAEVDVADRDRVYRWSEEIIDEFGVVHAIVNNAGVSLTATVEHMKYEDFEWVMGINFWGVVYGTKAFLPLVRETGDGHIVNISSIFGILGIPAQSAYNSAKFAVKGFTEALIAELKVDQVPVNVTVVHPGGIKTGIARRGRFEEEGMRGVTQAVAADRFENEFTMTTAEKAAEVIAGGMLKDKDRVMIGLDAHALMTMHRLLPTSYLKLVASQAKRLT